MEIGKEIKQSKFKDEYHKLTVNILYTSSWLTSMHITRLKPFGITPQQFNVLRILRGQYPNPVTVNLIIERMLDKSSNASRLVEKLRLKKLVQRAVSEEDRRAVNVIITKEGLDLLQKLDKEEEKWREKLENLTVEQAGQLNTLLDLLRG